MSVIDNAKTHFENLGVQSIEVPEWKDEHGKPTIIYWNPINCHRIQTGHFPSFQNIFRRSHYSGRCYFMGRIYHSSKKISKEISQYAVHRGYVHHRHDLSSPDWITESPIC